MKKRGYFFTVDAFIATITIILGMVIVLSAYSFIREPAQELGLSDSTMRVLAYTNVAEINNDFIHTMIETGEITNRGNTIMQQAGEFYYHEQNNPGIGWIDKATSLIQNALPDGVPPGEYGFEVIIEDTIIHNRSEHLTFEPNVLSSSKIIISGIDLTTNSMWGPYKAEVNVWQN